MQAIAGSTQTESTQAPAARGIFQEVTEEFASERRLWTAVLVKAVEDWRTGTIRARREAQKFLFEDAHDFAQVCASAGIDPDCFRSKLLKIGQRVSMTGPLLHPSVA
jgi:hypothetical protein